MTPPSTSHRKVTAGDACGKLPQQQPAPLVAVRSSSPTTQVIAQGFSCRSLAGWLLVASFAAGSSSHDGAAAHHSDSAAAVRVYNQINT